MGKIRFALTEDAPIDLLVTDVASFERWKEKDEVQASDTSTAMNRASIVAVSTGGTGSSDGASWSPT